jgi:hypothetical protein
VVNIPSFYFSITIVKLLKKISVSFSKIEDFLLLLPKSKIPSSQPSIRSFLFFFQRKKQTASSFGEACCPKGKEASPKAEEIRTERERVVFYLTNFFSLTGVLIRTIKCLI